MGSYLFILTISKLASKAKRRQQEQCQKEEPKSYLLTIGLDNVITLLKIKLQAKIPTFRINY